MRGCRSCQRPHSVCRTLDGRAIGGRFGIGILGGRQLLHIFKVETTLMPRVVFYSCTGRGRQHVAVSTQQNINVVRACCAVAHASAKMMSSTGGRKMQWSGQKLSSPCPNNIIPLQFQRFYGFPIPQKHPFPLCSSTTSALYIFTFTVCLSTSENIIPSLGISIHPGSIPSPVSKNEETHISRSAITKLPFTEARERGNTSVSTSSRHFNRSVLRELLPFSSIAPGRVQWTFRR